MSAIVIRRPPRGALLQVSIGPDQAEEWRTDSAARSTMLGEFVKTARARGRRFVEVRGSRGEHLTLTEVAL